MPGVITFRVSTELHRRMQQHDTNWSDILRAAIEEELARDSRRAALRVLQNGAGVNASAAVAARKGRRGR